MDLLITILIFAAMSYFNKDKKKKKPARGSQKRPVQQPGEQPAQKPTQKSAQKPKLDLEEIFRELSRQMGVEIEEEKPKKVKTQKVKPQEGMSIKGQPLKGKAKDKTPAFDPVPKDTKKQELPTARKKDKAKNYEKAAIEATKPQPSYNNNALAEGMIWSQILGEPRSRNPYKPLALKK